MQSNTQENCQTSTNHYFQTLLQNPHNSSALSTLHRTDAWEPCKSALACSLLQSLSSPNSLPPASPSCFTNSTCPSSLLSKCSNFRKILTRIKNLDQVGDICEHIHNFHGEICWLLQSFVGIQSDITSAIKDKQYCLLDGLGQDLDQFINEVQTSLLYNQAAHYYLLRDLDGKNEGILLELGDRDFYERQLDQLRQVYSKVVKEKNRTIDRLMHQNKQLNIMLSQTDDKDQHDVLNERWKQKNQQFVNFIYCLLNISPDSSFDEWLSALKNLKEVYLEENPIIELNFEYLTQESTTSDVIKYLNWFKSDLNAKFKMGMPSYKLVKDKLGITIETYSKMHANYCKNGGFTFTCPLPTNITVKTGTAHNLTYLYLGQVNSSGEKQGLGIDIWSDGDMHMGRQARDMCNGYGKYYWTNGVFYEGEWRDDTRHGYGTLITSDNKQRTGYWDHDVFTHT